jgi:lysophospholipase L1-like esterase
MTNVERDSDMKAVRPVRFLLIVLAVLLASADQGSRPAGAAPPPTFNPPKQFYLSLGDSLAYGLQFQKYNDEYPNVIASTFNTGFVDDFAALLAAVRPGIQTVNYGCPGETSDTFLTGGCGWLQDPANTLHTPFTGSQMSAALAFLGAHPGQVSPITLDMGINDLLFGCGLTPDCAAQTLPQITTNLNAILSALRQAAPYSEILVVQYDDAFAYTDASTTTAIEELNQVIASVAATYRAGVVDAFTPFNLASPQPQTLCTLTLICNPNPDLADPHPSDAGYQLIAQLLWAASGYDRFTH